jgi:hypothetical protein
MGSAVKVTSYVVDEAAEFARDTPVTVRIDFECTRQEINEGITDDIPAALSLAIEMVHGLRRAGERTADVVIGDADGWAPTGVRPVRSTPTPVPTIAAGFAAPPPTYLGAPEAWRQHQVGQSPLTEATLAELRRQAASETNLRAEQWWRAQRARDVAGWSGHRPMRNEWLEPYPKGWP